MIGENKTGGKEVEVFINEPFNLSAAVVPFNLFFCRMVSGDCLCGCEKKAFFE